MFSFNQQSLSCVTTSRTRTIKIRCIRDFLLNNIIFFDNWLAIAKERRAQGKAQQTALSSVLPCRSIEFSADAARVCVFTTLELCAASFALEGTYNIRKKLCIKFLCVSLAVFYVFIVGISCYINVILIELPQVHRCWEGFCFD